MPTTESVRIQPPSEFHQIIMKALAVLWKDWPRDMEVVETSGNGFVLRGTCPHAKCRTLTTFKTVQAFVENPNIAYQTMIGALRCDGCHQYILGIISSQPGNNRINWSYRVHYPVGTPDDCVSDVVPENVRNDFREAIRCRWLDCLKATVLMCRRSLETSCDREGAQGKDLFNQIDDLAHKQVITEPLRKMAYRIRLLGKKGAHGDYSDIDDTITKQDADEAIRFMRHYLDHVYILKAELEPPSAASS